MACVGYAAALFRHSGMELALDAAATGEVVVALEQRAAAAGPDSATAGVVTRVLADQADGFARFPAVKDDLDLVEEEDLPEEIRVDIDYSDAPTDAPVRSQPSPCPTRLLQLTRFGPGFSRSRLCVRPFPPTQDDEMTEPQLDGFRPMDAAAWAKQEAEYEAERAEMFGDEEDSDDDGPCVQSPTRCTVLLVSDPVSHHHQG